MRTQPYLMILVPLSVCCLINLAVWQLFFQIMAICHLDTKNILQFIILFTVFLNPSITGFAFMQTNFTQVSIEQYKGLMA